MSEVVRTPNQFAAPAAGLTDVLEKDPGATYSVTGRTSKETQL
jgi:hypothetical protein